MLLTDHYSNRHNLITLYIKTLNIFALNQKNNPLNNKLLKNVKKGMSRVSNISITVLV